MFLFRPCHWHLMENTFMCSTNIKLTGPANVSKLLLRVCRAKWIANQQPVWISCCFRNMWLETPICKQRRSKFRTFRQWDLSDKDNLCQIKLSPQCSNQEVKVTVKDKLFWSRTVCRNPGRLLHHHGILLPSLSSFSQRFPSLCVQPFHPLILLLFLSSSIPRSLRCTGFVWSVFPYTRSQGAQGQLHRQEEEALALAAQHSRWIPQEGRKEGVRRQIFIFFYSRRKREEFE